MSEEKYIGKAKMKELPTKPFLFKLKEGTVFLKHLAGEVLDKFGIIDTRFDEVDTKINDTERHLVDSTDNLQNQIDSLEVAGVALSNEFGDNKNIGISQWALSHWARTIQQRLDALTGENSRGMYMTTSKDYVVGYRGKINITASCANIQGIFDHIAIYANNQLIAEQDGTPFLEHEIKIKENTEITCVAKIMGEEFTESKTISYFKKAFYLGGGKTYNDIFNMEHLYALENGTQRGSYNIECNQGDHIIILLDNALGEEFIAAYMDGFLPIPFTQEDIIIDGDSYHLLMSENIYAADTYNVIIDVNSPEPMPVSPELSWSAESATVTIGADDNVYPTLSNPNDVEVTYSSSDENVVTINENTGAISLVEAGEGVITAAFVGDDTFEPQAVSYTLTVEVPVVETYTLTFMGQNLSNENLTVKKNGEVVELSDEYNDCVEGDKFEFYPLEPYTNYEVSNMSGFDDTEGEEHWWFTVGAGDATIGMTYIAPEPDPEPEPEDPDTPDEPVEPETPVEEENSETPNTDSNEQE